MHVIFIISLNLKKVGRSGPRNITSNRYGLTLQHHDCIYPKVVTVRAESIGKGLLNCHISTLSILVTISTTIINDSREHE